MKIAIFTLPRTPEYLTATLQNMVAKDPAVRPENIGLFYQALVAPTLPFPIGKVEVADADWLAEVERIKARSLGLAATMNYVRALRWSGQTMFPDTVSAVFEDDLIFADNWMQRVLALAAIAKRAGHRWAISLHHFYELTCFEKIGGSRGVDLMRWRNPDWFYGSQAMVYSPHVATELANAFESKIKTDPNAGSRYYMDMGIKRFATELGFSFYATEPCLIQHVGEVSVAIPGRRPLVNKRFRQAE